MKHPSKNEKDAKDMSYPSYRLLWQELLSGEFLSSRDADI
jgi:hypothetical protein